MTDSQDAYQPQVATKVAKQMVSAQRKCFSLDVNGRRIINQARKRKQDWILQGDDNHSRSVDQHYGFRSSKEMESKVLPSLSIRHVSETSEDQTTTVSVTFIPTTNFRASSQPSSVI